MQRADEPSLFARFRAYWRRPRSKTAETVETVVVALFLALFLRSTVAEARFIPSESMLPTLKVGDRLIIEKLSYHLHPPQRGDIIVFTPPADALTELGMSNPSGPVPDLLSLVGLTSNNALIKRVIGLPGDTVAVHDGKVFVDGKALVEPYEKEPPAYVMDPIKVPADELFVMGDNRNNSADSHVWGFLPEKPKMVLGFIPESPIIGKAVFRFWPPSRIGPIPEPTYSR